MSIAADEVIVRKAIADYALDIPELGRVIPGPTYFEDGADYLATLETVAYETRYEIETDFVQFCSIYLRSPTDDPQSPADSPVIRLNYEIYIFSEISPERVDETIAPDDFNKLMLKRYNDFVAGLLTLKSALQGKRNIAGLDPTIYAVAKTNPLTVTEEIQNSAKCEFIPGIQGYSIRFREMVELQLIAC